MKQLDRLLIFGLLFSSVSIFGQNLVNNGSFENYTSCPSGHGQINFVDYWYTAATNLSSTSASADFYHTCASSSNYSVPLSTNNNTLGMPLAYQHPVEGNAYVGIFVYGHNNMSREYIQAELSKPLKKDAIYSLSFYVNIPNLYGYGSSGIGGFLSSGPISSSSGIINVTPQVENPHDTIITDTLNWVKISGSFRAIGNEKYLTIGNFRNDQNTDTLMINPLSNQGVTSYMFIDQVVLTQGLDFEIYPNPIEDLLNIKFTNISTFEEIRIYNSIGQLIKRFNATSLISVCDISDLNSGVYFVNIITNNDEHFSKRFIKI
jgi:hypothetical protein